jgi:hypothetical protein
MRRKLRENIKTTYSKGLQENSKGGIILSFQNIPKNPIFQKMLH